MVDVYCIHSEMRLKRLILLQKINRSRATYQWRSFTRWYSSVTWGSYCIYRARIELLAIGNLTHFTYERTMQNDSIRSVFFQPKNQYQRKPACRVLSNLSITFLWIPPSSLRKSLGKFTSLLFDSCIHCIQTSVGYRLTLLASRPYLPTIFLRPGWADIPHPYSTAGVTWIRVLWWHLSFGTFIRIKANNSLYIAYIYERICETT